MRSNNPMLREEVYSGQSIDAVPMTVSGAINKTFLMMLIVVASGAYTWMLFLQGQQGMVNIILPVSAIIGFILAIVCSFNPPKAPVLAPLYALCEGFFLGGISAMYASLYHGIVLQAIALTVVTLFTMLAMYRLKLLQATPMFRKVVLIGTLSIVVFYLISIVAGFMGASLSFMTDFSPLSIGISLVVIGFAAMNLIIDFDIIERGAQNMLPKYFEWYGAFAMMVTLIWLYIEFLRLLSKINRK